MGLLLWFQVLQQRAQVAEVTKVLIGKVIVLDPGHGGVDPGIVGPGGTKEEDVVLGITQYLREFLEATRCRVILTRERDQDLADGGRSLSERKRLDLKKRVEIANQPGVDIFLTIHANGTPSSRWHGAQVFYLPEGHPDNGRLARHLQAELTRITGKTNRQVNVNINQYVLREVKVPAANVEVGFLSNPTEERLLARADYQREVAWAIFVGLSKYLTQGALPVIK
ncbi:MAG: N-acetylmuramoyl-L-alanine amidase [Firmicutes bacterium]|nr:N-acetylmuramoyl-L-alanine amidase [Bacillota bacterium]MCL5040475.1 N-acetylmuramoyl-L-alanine amidase [Bacillota bacterium]